MKRRTVHDFFLLLKIKYKKKNTTKFSAFIFGSRPPRKIALKQKFEGKKSLENSKRRDGFYIHSVLFAFDISSCLPRITAQQRIYNKEGWAVFWQ